jgi:GNAT superfamily N-acetyltransferase
MTVSEPWTTKIVSAEAATPQPVSEEYADARADQDGRNVERRARAAHSPPQLDPREEVPSYRTADSSVTAPWRLVLLPGLCVLCHQRLPQLSCLWANERKGRTLRTSAVLGASSWASGSPSRRDPRGHVGSRSAAGWRCAGDGVWSGGGEPVTRMQPVVRPASAEDLPAIEEMWGELRETGGRLGRAMSDPAAAAASLAKLIGNPEARLFIAVIDDEPVGLAYVVCQPLVPLQASNAVHIAYIHVRPEHRRRGMGRALMVAVLDYADDIGADQISVAVDPTLRDASRFFARLGLRPLTMVRSSSSAVLRRRLAADELRADVATDLMERRKRFLTRSRIRAVMVRLAERSAEPVGSD